MRAVPCLVQQAQHGGERLRIVTDAADQRVQGVMQGVGATRKETVGIAIVELERIFNVVIGDKPFGQGADAAPTAAVKAAVADVREKVGPLMQAWRKLVDSDLPALNQQLKQAGSPEIKSD